MGIADDHPVREALKGMSRFDPPWIPVAYEILAAVNPSNEYTLNDLAALVRRDPLDKDMFAATLFLGSCSDPIFDVRLCICHAGERHVFNKGDHQAVLDNNSIAHPVTGEMIGSPADIAFLLYRGICDPVRDSEGMTP
jgi:hypothetical protein